MSLDDSVNDVTATVAGGATSFSIDIFDDIEDDFEILQAASNQASIAIGRARLLEAERARADEHKALLDTMADLSGELELSRVIQSTLERAVSLLGVTGGEVAIFHEDTDELEVVSSQNVGKDSTGTAAGMDSSG